MDPICQICFAYWGRQGRPRTPFSDDDQLLILLTSRHLPGAHESYNPGNGYPPSAAPFDNSAEPRRQVEAEDRRRREEEERTRREMEAELGRLTGEASGLNTVVAGARADVGRLNGEIQAAKGENNRIKGELNAAKGELDKVKADLRQSQNDVVGLKRQLESSQVEVKRLMDRLTELDKMPSIGMSGEGHSDYGVGQLGQLNLEDGELNIG